MIIGLAVSIIISLLFGTFGAQFFCPFEISPRTRPLLALTLGMGLGFGVSSILLFFWLMVFGSLSRAYLFVETSLSLSLFLVFFYARGKLGTPVENVRSKLKINSQLTRWCAAAFFISLVCIFTTAVTTLAREPHGQGDAVAIWNLHARFIFRGGSEWANAFRNELIWSHPDYPLLIPLSVARCWAYAGETQLAPALIALLFTFGTVGLVVSSASILRTRTQGYLAGLVLLEPYIFFRAGTYEYADTPLGFFLLATLVLFCLKDRAPGSGSGLLVLAGMMAGFAAWAKNEGLLFVVAVIAARFIAVSATKGVKTCAREMRYFGAGVAPALLCVTYFKLRSAPTNDLVAGQGWHSTVERLHDFSRYGVILKAFANQFTGFRKWYLHPAYMLLIYPCFVGLKTQSRERTTLLTMSVCLGLMLTGYFFVYVTTPRDLEWHLRFSLDRLLIQLWPSLVLLYFFIVRSPEQAIDKPKEANQAF